MLNLWRKITAPLSKCGQMATRPALAQMNPMLELILYTQIMSVRVAQYIIILNPYIMIEEPSTE